MEYITRGPCGQEGCRETRYYLDSGIWFCRRGHQQEGRQIEEDPEDFGKLGRISRVKRTAAEKIQKTFRGKEAYRLFVHAYQYVLWTQCHALVHAKGYPADLEVVVRDLWALRLRSLVKKLDDLPEDDDDVQASSSQAASGIEAEFDDTREQFMPRRPSSTPRLVETLGLCYLGCLLLRLPTSVGDIYRLAMAGDIPYIRVVRSLPNDIKDRLPQVYLRQFDTPYLLTNERLHEVVNHLIIMYHGEYGTDFPPLNAPLLLFEYIRQLSLPLEVYTVVRKLNQMLKFTYDFSLSSKATLRNLGFPELQLMAQLVVATKLIFPFENTTKFPSSPSEPAAQSLDWKRWSQIRADFAKKMTEGKIAKGRHILLEEDDVFDLTPEQLDDYMDWYETRWLDTSKSHNPIAEMFRWSRPETTTASSAAAPSSTEDDTNERLAFVISSLRPVKSVKKKDRQEHPQPGTSYQQYQSEAELPENARIFYEAAAELSGISLHSLVRAVVQVEVKLQEWMEDWRRAVYHGLIEESSSEEEASEDTVLEAEE